MAYARLAAPPARPRRPALAAVPQPGHGDHSRRAARPARLRPAAPSGRHVGGRFVHADGSSDDRAHAGAASPWSALCFALGLSSVLPGEARHCRPEAPRPWSPDLAEDRAVPVVSGAFVLVRGTCGTTSAASTRCFSCKARTRTPARRGRGCRPIVAGRAVCRRRGQPSPGPAQASWCCCSPASAACCGGISRAGCAGRGVGLLLTGVLLRATASRVIGTASAARQARPTARDEARRALWAARDEWRRGGPDSPPRRAQDVPTPSCAACSGCSAAWCRPGAGRWCSASSRPRVHPQPIRRGGRGHRGAARVPQPE